MSMAFSDIREFIEGLRKAGELADVNAEVDWRYEIGAIVRKNLDLKGPALLFSKIKGYNSALFTCGVSTYSRLSFALGLGANQKLGTLVSEVGLRLDNPIKAKKIDSGPCKQVILTGDEADVLKFPVPLWQDKDGGRYIGTWHGVITRDPETGCLNGGMYRVMVHDGKTLGILLARDQHIGVHYHKYRKMNKPMPVAIVIGTDPVLPLAFLTPVPLNADEYDVAGGLRGKAIELVKCETVDLDVPATAEIVIEGEISDQERMIEGPFGEWMGHYGGDAGPKPVIHVKCITHRIDPVFRGTLEGRPVNEDHICTSVVLSALAQNTARKTLGIPGVRGIHFPAAAGGWGMAIVSIDQRYPAHSRTIAHALLSMKAGAFLKNVIVVDDDVDPFNLDEVWWAMTSRLQASQGINILQRGKGAFMDPSQQMNLRGFTDTLIVEAVKPYEWRPRPEWGGERFPPIAQPSREIMEAVDRRWKELGIMGNEKMVREGGCLK